MKEEDIINIVKNLFKNELDITCDDPYVGGELTGQKNFF